VSHKRLLAAVLCDIRLQFRQGFYYAAAFVAAVLVFGLSRLPPFGEDVDWLVPPIIISNLTLGTFYFMAALVLLEKGEGTLEALVVTPLRDAEYLASKIATLTLLSLVENLLIVMAFYGPRLGLGSVPLALGIALASALLTLVGFVAVAGYDSINEFLAPSVMYASLASVPVFTWLLRWDHWLLLAHPLQAVMLIMYGGFEPLEPWQLLYGGFYSTVWIALVAFWSRRVFQRFVVAPAGAH
jgi:fluoroquinolone transport system permease protein